MVDASGWNTLFRAQVARNVEETVVVREGNAPLTALSEVPDDEIAVAWGEASAADRWQIPRTVAGYRDVARPMVLATGSLNDWSDLLARTDLPASLSVRPNLHTIAGRARPSAVEVIAVRTNRPPAELDDFDDWDGPFGEQRGRLWGRHQVDFALHVGPALRELGETGTRDASRYIHTVPLLLEVEPLRGGPLEWVTFVIDLVLTLNSSVRGYLPRLVMTNAEVATAAKSTWGIEAAPPIVGELGGKVSAEVEDGITITRTARIAQLYARGLNTKKGRWRFEFGEHERLPLIQLLWLRVSVPKEADVKALITTEAKLRTRMPFANSLGYSQAVVLSPVG